MTEDVVVAFADTLTRDVAELVAALRLTAIPVIDLYDHVIGVVSASDLPLVELLAAADRRKWPWRRRRTGTVDEVMTAPAVTVPTDTVVRKAARLMVSHRVKQLPVVDGDEKLCGIVTCRDLLAPALRSDAEIHDEIMTDVLGRYLPSVAASVNVRVDEAIVTVSGYVPATGMVPLALHLIRSVDGVVDVVDDTATAENGSRVSPSQHR